MYRLIPLTCLSLLVTAIALPPSVVAQGSKGLIREAAQHQRSKNVAIVVGVEQYDEASTGVSRLEYAADDAVKLATVFQQNRYVVKRLVDHQASKHQILAAIKNAARLIDPQNSTLVFSFSGHGFAQGSKNYLMAAGSTTSNLQASALKLDDVINALRQSRAKRIVVFIDACRNIPGQKAMSRGFTKQNGQGVQILLSTKFGGLSWESPKLRQGVFSHFLAKGLQGEASRGDGIVEFNDLAQYVESNVKDWTFQHLNKVQQPYRRPYGEFFGRFVVTAKGRFQIEDGNQAQQRRQREQQQAQQRLQQQRQREQQLAQQQAAAAQRQRQQLALQAQQRQQQQAAAAQRQRQQLALQVQQRQQSAVPEPRTTLIRGGRFIMGSPANETGRNADEKQHWVNVGDFYMAQHEVSVFQFRRFVQMSGYKTDAEKNAGGRQGCSIWNNAVSKWQWSADKSWRNPGFPQDNNHPVVCVSWNDANAYAKWLSQQTGKTFRLPTEAEWEYAARAGTQEARYWGDNPNQACHYANVADQKVQQKFNGWPIHHCNDNALYTSAVGRYQPNAYGLHDVLGNVSEWTCSAYDQAYGGSERQCKGNGDGRRRVLRGGSWLSLPRFVRSAYRDWGTAAGRNGHVGFRLTRAP